MRKLILVMAIILIPILAKGDNYQFFANALHDGLAKIGIKSIVKFKDLDKNDVPDIVIEVLYDNPNSDLKKVMLGTNVGVGIMFAETKWEDLKTDKVFIIYKKKKVFWATTASLKECAVIFMENKDDPQAEEKSASCILETWKTP